MAPPAEPVAPTRPRRSRLRRLVRWSLLAPGSVFAAFLTYGVAIAIGWLVPVNSAWTESDEGTPICVWSNGVHVDLVLPIDAPGFDWWKFAPSEDYAGEPRPSGLRYVLIGWGDKGFYVETETWSDLSLMTVAKAMFWPTDSVMHVQYLYELPESDDDCRHLTLRDDEYRRLLDHLLESFRRVDDRPVLVAGASYGWSDGFYESGSSYHLLNTCNNWTNTTLKVAGVRTALWAPFSTAILSYRDEDR